ncbi:hypothetical protein N665_1670s0001 [Sinapis alba]|nr:hypothetical protein N665_1670s0001 [Sinapis alba]
MGNKSILALCLVFLVTSSVIYEAQGTFLLKWYLRRKMFKKAMEFTPFACKGMIFLLNRLKDGCPATKGFKTFFTLFTSYVNFIKTTTVSKNTNTELTTKADDIVKALSTLTGTKKVSTPTRISPEIIIFFS